MKRKKDRYYFFLNPYIDNAFTRCPECSCKTRVRKIPLAIMLEKEKIFLCLNKTCKYCPYCELIIAKKQEIEDMLKIFLGREELGEEDYLVFGTQDKKIWRKGLKHEVDQEELYKGITLFKDVWDFKVVGCDPKDK